MSKYTEGERFKVIALRVTRDVRSIYGREMGDLVETLFCKHEEALDAEKQVEHPTVNLESELPGMDYEIKTEAEKTADSRMRLHRELAESREIIEKLKSEADYWRNKLYPVFEDNGSQLTMHMLGEDWVKLDLFQMVEAERNRLRDELNDRGVFHAETEIKSLREDVRGIQESLSNLWALRADVRSTK